MIDATGLDSSLSTPLAAGHSFSSFPGSEGCATCGASPAQHEYMDRRKALIMEARSRTDAAHERFLDEHRWRRGR